MISLIKRVRWAIVLPLLQGTIFVIIGVIGHRESVVYSRQGEASTIVYWGCTELRSKPRMQEERPGLVLVVDCRSSLVHQAVFLSNLPVFITSAAAADLTANRNVNQVWLFYGINGIGIPLFWYWIGTRIDRRLRRVRAPNHSKGFP